MLRKFLLSRRKLHDKVCLRDTYVERLKRLDIALQTYCENSYDVDIPPHAVELVDFPEVRNIMAINRNVALSADVFAPWLPSLVERAVSDRTAHLVSLLTGIPPANYHQPSSCLTTTRAMSLAPIYPLSLARSFCQCIACRDILTTTSVLFHPCCYPVDEDWDPTPSQQRYLDGKLPIIGSEVYANAVQVCFKGRRPWSTTTLSSWGARVDTIIKACGFDPEVATAEEMDRVDARIACMTCSIRGRAIVVMSWKRAVGSFTAFGSGRADDGIAGVPHPRSR